MKNRGNTFWRESRGSEAILRDLLNPVHIYTLLLLPMNLGCALPTKDCDGSVRLLYLRQGMSAEGEADFLLEEDDDNSEVCTRLGLLSAARRT
jgi:hypothetical protein